MKRRAALLLSAALLAVPAGAAPEHRTVVVTETVRVPVEKAGTRVRLWVPKPPSRDGQSVEVLSVSAPWPHRVTREGIFGNETLYFEGSAAAAGEQTLSVRYRVRREALEAPLPGQPAAEDRSPRGKEVVDSEIRRIAAAATAGLSDPQAKGRALFRVVLARMEYDKKEAGWGEGDSARACRVGKGNCTDFHALFMALAHSAGLPARFRMGYSLPAAQSGSLGSGYHCWAEFHAGKAGWVPVDISEASKAPAEKAETFFGRLDSNRVLVSTGREVVLSPRQTGKPLNFLSRPYGEFDGRPNSGLYFERSFASPEPGG
ncbi:transglutaminase domain-containing protein [bacterium]|nr:MAG: transglutaminase domain-containing protein [bacterium]